MDASSAVSSDYLLYGKGQISGNGIGYQTGCEVDVGRVSNQETCGALLDTNREESDRKSVEPRDMLEVVLSENPMRHQQQVSAGIPSAQQPQSSVLHTSPGTSGAQNKGGEDDGSDNSSLDLDLKQEMAYEKGELSPRSLFERFFSCPFCPFQSLWESHMERHMATHAKEYPSTEFPYANSSQDEPKIKRTTHSKMKQFSCSQCSFQCTRKSGLNAHMKSSHPEEKPLICPYCSYRTSEQEELTEHIRIHTRDKPFKCEFCNYGTANITNFETHLKIHSGDKPYLCPLCDFRAAEKPQWEEHVKKHISMRQLSCNRCDFTTTERALLREHTKTHEDEKRYSCEHCDFKASFKCHIKRHMRIHKMERFFPCDECSYSAFQISDLRRHLKVHKSKTYETDEQRDNLLSQS